MPREFALAVADKCAYAVMATVNPDGTPYCVPLSMVREGEWIYFHSARSGHKIDNLKHNKRVCISCTGDIRPDPGKFSIMFESAIIFGTASEVTEREEKIHALRLISERYMPADMAGFDEAAGKAVDATSIWKIHIDEISGKAKS
jgi:nitroimidazol reductase NimA-like FMN-containing flavoprotein (pyridoxamine 5'-phosphate oxidase superfamily)